MLADEDILHKAMEALEPHGLRFRVRRRGKRGADQTAGALIGLRFGGRDVRYVALVKRGLRPATLGALIHQLRGEHGKPLLVTNHVTPPLADALRARGVEFIDAAGNAS